MDDPQGGGLIIEYQLTGFKPNGNEKFKISINGQDIMVDS
jgi:hypothetical protein